MSDSLHVIALISGGKDSLFCILHCLENGHKIVALANLHPKHRQTSQGADEALSNSNFKRQGEEDLNSFMYQTVGHSVIPLYAECLDLPLYRRHITGSAVQTGRYYDTINKQAASDKTEDEDEDETENLVPLLQEVMRNHPEANAVCSGAILSTYQRTRVESIAIRLGLTPLAYLWQYPALPPPTPNDSDGRGDSLTGLLDDMAAAGCDARIIKIASGGIRESLLWTNVADARVQLRLVSGLRPFFADHEFGLRGAVLGEGGEYETLAVNGPKRLWKKRIEVSDGPNLALTGDGGASYIRVGKAVTAEHDPKDIEQEDKVLRVPKPLDPQFEAILLKYQNQRTDISGSGSKAVEDPSSSSYNVPQGILEFVHNLSSTHLSISNITMPSSSLPEVDNNATTQMKQICDKLDAFLASVSTSPNLPSRLTTSNIVFSTLILKNISNFAAVNSIYSSLFRSGEPNPPARVTVACPLPENVEVSLSVVLDRGPREARRGLHVQSRSYWAPANIGPYSQAICVPLVVQLDSGVNVHDAESVEMAHMAGQIPLVPQSMQVAQTSFHEQAVLSLQHLWRVGQERGVDIWPWGIAFLQHEDGSSYKVDVTYRIWHDAHRISTRTKINSPTEDENDQEEGPDAWDLQYNRSQIYEVAPLQMTVGNHRHILPHSTIFKDTTSESVFIPPFIAAEILSLPRHAPVEWWSLGIANLPEKPHSTPRISTSRKHYSWGSTNRVTIHPSTSLEERAQSGARETWVHLVTVLVHLNPLDISSDVKLVEEVLLDLLLPKSDLGTLAFSDPEIVHGTAFISHKGYTYWTKMRERPLFATLTVIPCTTLYGNCRVDTSIDDPGDESSGISVSKSSTKKTEQEVSSLRPNEETDIKNDAAAQCPWQCRPLAAAMTIRIDESRD
ncbi:uncharacterized protein Z518_04918 [Rhinocladiella mackenziei CBS 650.93]|uniref:Diphthine--ammonia ligase n=1 Tax=Rhinocladiella mackenziei CBS 650.93 TaxID=1442369 RepID=A0A0D2FX89_9EURO|nr:uncharacterized protein Z518_04918 [Rhinocladiella mackenziei CBS 650.93]KIX06942.1 hypothetical protein Z518_04918 [Rhinocladiella mackenziei CBS 650.93]